MVGGLASTVPTYVSERVPAASAIVPREFPLAQELTSRLKAERHMAAAPLFALGVTALFVVYLAAFCVAKGRWSRAARNLVLAFAALF